MIFYRNFIFHSQTFFYNFLPFYWGRHNLHWRLPRRRYLFQKILFLGLQRLQSCCLLFIVCYLILIFVFYTFLYTKKNLLIDHFTIHSYFLNWITSTVHANFYGRFSNIIMVNFIISQKRSGVKKNKVSA